MIVQMLATLNFLPLGATTALADQLLYLFILLVAAKTGEEIFRRIKQPVVAGEILAGVVVGPSVLGWIEPSEVIDVFAELGVVFLLFWVGLETRLSDIRAVGKPASFSAVLGVIIPAAAGFALGQMWGKDTATSFFIGAALAATSVGITSAILLELRQLDTPAGRTILGAAVIDDILALLLLAVATGLAESGSVDLGEIAIISTLALAFVSFFALGGTRALRRWPQVLEAPKFAQSPLMPSVIICLGLAVLAAEIGLAAVIGAFLAGMMIAETKDQNAIESEIAPLYAFFAPFFFTTIGTQIDLSQFSDSGTVGLLLMLTTVAVITKFIGASIGSLSLGRRNALIVGVGAIPRGEVGIIVAGIGLSSGVIDNELFAVVIGMSLITTLIAPPLLKYVIGRSPPALPDGR